ncbi:peptidoglycan bridge formation glycyltransferase FemA/FemB family protein, partial [Bacillus mobilis]|uniref:peptidoglycan bridge formation glycyltransferase FemA/FemB family protein n=1 Tax=Bacillus mobilis TaxID=2026190 RepID=UPI00366C41C6
AMQWRMLRDAYALGATVYDLRGISDSLDETDHLFGLIQFKVWLPRGMYLLPPIGQTYLLF